MAVDIPKAYEWTFDRNPWDAVEGATRLSVGVYQWLPTKSGRGLKRSKSIRVQGYVADSARVYGKARGLCLRLNSENVHAEKPPEWLQKSYSVPRPDGVTLGRFSEGLTGVQVRSAREQVMKSSLVPLGFIKGNGGIYVRQSGEQIHLIDFQPSRYGGSYFVNLAFHYAFVAPFYQQHPFELRKYQLLDCSIRQRVTGEFKYGFDVAVLKSMFVSNVDSCLEVFQRVEKKWKDPAWWLGKIDSTGKFKINSIAPWRLDDPDLFVTCVAIHLRKFDIAKRQIERMRPAVLKPKEARWIKQYNRVIRAVAGNDRYAI